MIFSDGITEAVDADDNEFGEDRLTELVMEHTQDTSAQLIDRTIEAVRKHAGVYPQADDMTMVVVRRTK